MNPTAATRLERLEEIFHAARELDRETRRTFIETSCAGDDDLRREIESLLESDEKAPEFIASLPAELSSDVIEIAGRDAVVGRTIGHYEVLERIGSGGMGDVYLVRDLRSPRKAALKLLPPQFALDADRFRRFEQEAQTVVALNHPNILTVYEIGEENGAHYLVSELIEGETLRARLQRGVLQIEEALDVAIQVASALVAAHKAGVVHRDIKPENIMLREDGYVKVLDFGIAKLAEQELETAQDGALAGELGQTAVSLRMGTLRYMSPEQTRGEHVDGRSDI